MGSVSHSYALSEICQGTESSYNEQRIEERYKKEEIW